MIMCISDEKLFFISLYTDQKKEAKRFKKDIYLVFLKLKTNPFSYFRVEFLSKQFETRPCITPDSMQKKMSNNAH